MIYSRIRNWWTFMGCRIVILGLASISCDSLDCQKRKLHWSRVIHCWIHVVLLGLMIDVKEVICGDPTCSPIDTLVTIGEIELFFVVHLYPQDFWIQIQVLRDVLHHSDWNALSSERSKRRLQTICVLCILSNYSSFYANNLFLFTVFFSLGGRGSGTFFFAHGSGGSNSRRNDWQFSGKIWWYSDA